MPELPEVETIRRGLEAKALHKTIERVEVRCRKIVLRPTAKQLSAYLAGQTIQDVRRRGKFLVLETHEFILLVHLGMSGQMTYWDKKRKDDEYFFINPLTGLQQAQQHVVDKHTHVSIYFTDGNALHYRDIRQFGKWRLYAKQDFHQAQEYWKLGLEPFTAEYEWNNFLAKFGGRKLRIKSLLLDQRFVAGVGNIYADEALFEARIHPERRVSSLTTDEKKRLFKAIPTVLRRGLHYGGTSFQSYFNAEGEAGTNQEYLNVYGRTLEKCRRCRTEILRIVVSQRSTHCCPQCQPKKRSRKELPKNNS
jgi:formamidopyrimidine-DNA glycosylase